MSVCILVIDMLKDFVLEGAPLEVPKAREIVPNIRFLLEEARKRKIPVVYVCDAHNEGDGEFDLWPAHAVKGTRGAEVIDEIKPQKGDYVVEKRRYSGFYETDLDLTLRELGVRKLVVTGILTNVCVQYTVADAYFRGYEVVVLSDCTASTRDEDHEYSLGHMQRIFKARVMTSKEVVEKGFQI